MLLRRVVRIRNRRLRSFCHPLLCACRTLSQFPFVIEKVLKKVIAPFRRGLTPSYFKAARNRIAAFACAESIMPAEALRFERRAFRIGANVRCGAGSVGL